MTRVSVDGGELGYTVGGTGSPVVLVHGGSLDRGTWDDQAAAFESRHTVVRYDLRGHGASSEPTEPFAHYADLAVLLDHLDLPRVSLVGHSLGARVVVDFALSNPDRVDRLVLAAPGISGMTFRNPVLLRRIEELIAVRAAGDTERAVELLLRIWVDGPHRTPEQVAPAVRARCAAMITDAVTGHTRAAQTMMRELSAIDRVGEVHAATLVVTGDRDWSDIHGVVSLLARELPDVAVLDVAGAGHLVGLERPESFTEAVLGHLDR